MTFLGEEERGEKEGEWCLGLAFEIDMVLINQDFDWAFV